METEVVKNGELISFINSSFEVFEKHFRESFAKEGDLYRGFDMNLESISEERITREGMKIHWVEYRDTRKIQFPIGDILVKEPNIRESSLHYKDLIQHKVFEKCFCRSLA